MDRDDSLSTYKLICRLRHVWLSLRTRIPHVYRMCMRNFNNCQAANGIYELQWFDAIVVFLRCN